MQRQQDPSFARLPNSVSDLLHAKLQPREPTAAEWSASKGWPVTPRDHRLVVARGAEVVSSIETLAANYDAATLPQSRVLAAVFTYDFEDRPAHDMMSTVTTYAELHLAKRKLILLVVLHTPGDSMFNNPLYAHCVTPERLDGCVGWGRQCAEVEEESFLMWNDERCKFCASW